MIKAGIQIADGEVKDSFDEYGLIYISSDSIMAAPVKKYDVSSYAETAGEYIDPRTVKDAFDFKIKFAVLADPGDRIFPNVNMLHGTRDFTDAGDAAWSNKSQNQSITTDTYMGCRIARSGQQAGFGIYQAAGDVKAGEYLTFSAWVKADFHSGDIVITIPYADNATTTPRQFVITDAVSDGEWHRVSVTFKVDSTAQDICARVESSVAGNTIYVAGQKLEKGTEATAYVPFPGEPDYDYYASLGALAAPQRVNTLIRRFNDAMFEQNDGSDILTARKVTIYDHYKHRKIVGYPQQPLSDPEEYENVHGHQVAIMALMLRATDPNAVDFDWAKTVAGIGGMMIGVDFMVG